jgi:hypothetical protein
MFILNSSGNVHFTFERSGLMRGISKRNRGIKLLAGASIAALAALFPAKSGAAPLPNVVFDDTFNDGSTVGSASQSYSNTATPTSDSTNYDIASGKQATSSTSGTIPNGGPLKIITVSSTSAITQAAAIFTSTPVILQNVGDEIQLSLTFTNTLAVDTSSFSSAALYLGLYSSGGATPYNNMENGSSSVNTITGLNNTQINDNTGGTQNWNGFETDYFGGSKPKIYNRPAQTAGSANNTDQALVGTGQTGGYPTAGTQATYVSQSSTEAYLTAGSVYTDEITITLSSLAPNTYTLTQAIYNGSSDAGTEIGTTTSGTLAALASGVGFDGLAIGYRETAGGTGEELDVNSVEVSTNVPEPASIGLLGLAGSALMARRRRKA